MSPVILDNLGIHNYEDAIGMKIRIMVDGRNNTWKPCEIIGVMEGYRVRSLFTHAESTEPSDVYDRDFLALTFQNYLLPFLQVKKFSVRIDPDMFDTSIGRVEELYKQTFPDEQFNWYFLAEHINLYYQYEKISRNQIFLFSAVAILIAALGLLGMVNNKAIEKTKEIGIRKVLGANLIDICNLLLNTSTKQILISAIIAFPLSKYLVQQYLDKFDKQIPVNLWYFAFPVLIFISILVATISSLVFKAAKTNPVEALKCE